MQSMSKSDLLSWYRSTYRPGEKLPDWVVDIDTLAGIRNTRQRLREARAAAVSSKRRQQPATPRRRAAPPPRPTYAPTPGFAYSNRCDVVASANSTTTGPVRLYGYAALWDRLSVQMNGFRERISRGAFSNTLTEVKAKNHSVLAYLEHDHRMLLGRTGVNLELREDAKGLAFTLTLPNVTAANDAAELVRRGVVSGMSFGFMTRADSWDRSGAEAVRTLRDVLLVEVSIVGSPAYPQTAVHASRSSLTDHAWRAVYMRAASQRAIRSSNTTRAARSAPGVDGIEWR